MPLSGEKFSSGSVSSYKCSPPSIVPAWSGDGSSPECSELPLIFEPFEMASAEFPAPTALYAVPGNHDWYDNLVAFTRRDARQRRALERGQRPGERRQGVLRAI